MRKHFDEGHLFTATNEILENKPNPTKKECSYYKQGWCTKGGECKYEHIKSTHKCEKCSYTTQSSESLTIHLNNKHSKKRQTTSSKACRNSGSCEFKAQNKCKFSHKKSNISEPRKCKRGESCYHKTKGNRFFYHEDVGVQARRDSNKNESQGEL